MDQCSALGGGGRRPHRARTPVERIRSSMLASSDLAKDRLRHEEESSRSSTPKKVLGKQQPRSQTGTVNNPVNAGLKPGQLVWAIRSADLPASMVAGPWPAVVISSMNKGSLVIKWLGGKCDNISVAASEVQVCAHTCIQTCMYSKPTLHLKD